jgi:hypothetical protein
MPFKENQSETVYFYEGFINIVTDPKSYSFLEEEKRIEKIIDLY